MPPRLLRFRPLAIALCALAAAVPTPAHAAATLVIDDPITDNYKPSYNADPERTELRTWLSIRALRAGGTTWAPPRPDSIEIEDGTLQLAAADGRTGTLALRTASGPIAMRLLRVDPFAVESGGRWGPLIAIDSRAALQAERIVLDLALTVDGELLATGRVSYRHDATIAAVDTASIEYNGPGGRWYVGSTSTRLNWQDGPAIAPSVVAAETSPPRITSVVVPTRSTRRSITLRVTARAGSSRITALRVATAGRPFSRWVAIAPAYTVQLPRGRAYRGIRVQVRAADGRTSTIVSRRVWCSC